MCLKVIFLVWILCFKILFEFIKIDFISVLKLSIILMIFLNSIISQMNKDIFLILRVTVKLKTACTNIALFVPICFYAIVLNKKINYQWNEQIVTSNVEFSFLIKKRLLNIFLNDKCAWISLIFFLSRILFINKLFNWFQFRMNSNSLTSIWVLARFNNP